ncbi:nitrate reductase molybdenum cofactor assembly chaperone [Ferroacidibacillus organovorans]|uniref:Nitrate reductase molybdenum cofactor assembly chaperone n=1 Tax=Ferroacidibacillus organovorans TaxID=1765683 RepID=A0A853KDS9_9BACL|nr:nitrate reductase molybdenum cofactor assembly chaperone [Ferroacidibacillus organovorans]KYP79444.1 hypothetical protein AYJ22_03995 [Ferroacidibacillus organovorans]OAG94498.1 hypothetical protein AYW79_04740 [Ferroacidibacillus organovorans]
MTLQERLKIASVLLAYPEKYFSEFIEEIDTSCKETEDDRVLAAVDALARVPTSELLRCYVATFDMQESTALYLTAHELGDSRERGDALLRLQALLQSAAFEPLEGELPDYLPLLLEFIAEKPIGMPTDDLESRLAVVCQTIYEQLDEKHPYRKLFELIRDCLPNVLISLQDDSGSNRSKPVVETDLDNLPYPLGYD